MVLPCSGGPPVHATFRDLASFLREGDLLVVNRSRVRHARLLGRRANGGAAELLVTGPDASGTWSALVRPGRRLRAGDVVAIAPGVTVRIDSEALPPDSRRRVSFPDWRGDPEDLFAEHGHVPLPPYVQRADEASDRDRYQTIYAREKGSVAAPTAGLHFTPEAFASLEGAGVARAELVLHVGPGTFKPVSVDDVADHHVDPEPFVLPVETAEAVAAARARGGRVIAVGTTAARTLEARALPDGLVKPGSGSTDLVVVPGHRFRVIDGLVTNFHLPRSSLLLLVAAFAGRERILQAYAEAVARGYRFYSYGDAMLLV
jgi:S-adenosylmethionine:tRNA ribosyltransferase-isomerase